MAELDIGAVAVEFSRFSESIDKRVSFFWCLDLKGGSSFSSFGEVAVSWLSLPGVPATYSMFSSSSSSISCMVALMMLLQKNYPWNMGGVLWLSLTVCFPLFEQIWTSETLSSLSLLCEFPCHHLVSPKTSVALGCVVSQWTVLLFPLRLPGLSSQQETKPAPSSCPSPTGLLLAVGCCCQQHTQPRPSSVPR